MASHLARVAPLHHFISLAEFHGCHLQLPDNDHLIVTTAGQVLAIRGETDYIYCGRVTTLQVVLVLWLKVLLRLVLSRRLDYVRPKLWGRHLRKLPEAKPGVELIDLAACDEEMTVRVEVNGHDSR